MASEETKKEVNNLDDAGYHLLFDDVDTSSAQSAIEWIMESNLTTEKKHKELTFVICSPGGDLSAGFALIDVMRGSSIPIRTVGLGLIASCGLLLFISGAKGRRTLTPNTSIMSHQYTWGSYGKEHELFSTVREYELTTERMLVHYKKCTGLNEKQIREYLLPPHDVWLSGKEAKKLGICDNVKVMK